MRSKKLELATAAALVTGAGKGLELYKQAKNTYNEKFLYSGRISEDSYVYDILLRWLETQSSPRTIKFRSRFDGVTKHYDNNGTTKVNIKGYPVKVRKEEPEPGETKGYDGGGWDNIVFTSPTRAGIEAVYDFLKEMSSERKLEDIEVQFCYPSLHGWHQKDLPIRDIDSVFLPGNQKQEMLDDLEEFFNNEDHYRRIGAPWHRGYMIYGEPGNGKTSIITAIAHHYKLNLYTLALASLKDDNDLLQKIGSMEDRSILLIEDIDVFTHALSREQSDTGVTLSGLLNALDGVGTAHGMLTFITTNHVETLDNALVRDGRVDYRLELRAPVASQIEDIFSYAYGEPLGYTPRTFDNMAEVSNILKTNINTPDMARKELCE